MASNKYEGLVGEPELPLMTMTWPREPFCEGCIYYRPIAYRGSDKSMVCHYLYDTWEMRGCPVGKGCHRRKERGAKDGHVSRVRPTPEGP